MGNNVTEAQQKAYELVNTIQFKDAYFRTDIGYRAIARESSAD
jgi:phosphoribosylamine--glycine ligase